MSEDGRPGAEQGDNRAITPLERVRRVLRRRSVFYAVASVAVSGGVLLLAAAGASVIAVLIYLGVMWVLLMYLSRWRSR